MRFRVLARDLPSTEPGSLKGARIPSMAKELATDFRMARSRATGLRRWGLFLESLELIGQFYPNETQRIEAFRPSAAGADVIVTGDREMLFLGTWEGIEILSLRRFVDRLDQPREVRQARAPYRLGVRKLKRAWKGRRSGKAVDGRAFGRQGVRQAERCGSGSPERLFLARAPLSADGAQLSFNLPGHWP